MDNNNINQNNNHNNNFRENQNQNERRNEIIRVVQSENNRIRNNNSNNKRKSYDSSENNDIDRRYEPDLLIKYKCENENPSSTNPACLIIMFPGFSTLIIGILEKNAFWCLLSILNILLFILFFVFIFVFELYEVNYNLFKYSFVFVIIGPVFTIYASIFHNCLIFNPVKPELLRKEKKIISLIYNILRGGTGTLLYGLSNLCDKTNGKGCWQNYRHILYGLIQFAGFILLLIPFVLEDIIKKKIKIVFVVIGILSYCFSLFSGITLNIRCYEKRLFF